jgi:septal ring-binding cell division protein DamX
VVQLVASADQRGLDRFLAANQNSISSPFSTARTLSKGREWHVVLMGPFSNRSQANAAINQLPSRLRQNNPWVRQVSSVLSAAR